MLGKLYAKIGQHGTTGNSDVDLVYFQVSTICYWGKEFPKLDKMGRL